MADVLEQKEEKVRLEIAAEQEELNDFMDLPEEPAAKSDENDLPAESPEELSEAPGTGEPVKVEEAKEIDFEAEHTKLQEQVGNLNKALKSERDGKKDNFATREQELLDEIEALKLNPASTENEVDPDVEKTINSVLEKREAEAARKATDKHLKEWNENASDYVNTLAGEGADEETIAKAESDFETVVEGFFTPLAKKDEKLYSQFTKAEDPAKFAYEEGMKAMKASSSDSDDVTRLDERKKMVKELNDLNIGVSLSTLPGAPLTATKPKEKSDLDDFIDS